MSLNSLRTSGNALQVGMIGRSLSSTLKKSPKRAFRRRTHLRPRKYLSNDTLSFLREFPFLPEPFLPNYALRSWPRHPLMPRMRYLAPKKLDTQSGILRTSWFVLVGVFVLPVPLTRFRPTHVSRALTSSCPSLINLHYEKLRLYNGPQGRPAVGPHRDRLYLYDLHLIFMRNSLRILT
jgi:hypothetical protein